MIYSNNIPPQRKTFEEAASPAPESSEEVLFFSDCNCKYAVDTGKKAFLSKPCRGNRILCRKLEGHFSFTKACTPERCQFFEAKNSSVSVPEKIQEE